MLVDPRTGHRLLFIEVPGTTLPKKRMHLDLAPIDRSRDDEVARITGLGATLTADRRLPDGSGWVVFADPEGNEFCVVRSDAERGDKREPSFEDADLSGSRFVRCYFDGATFRGVSLSKVSIDGEIDGLSINGIDVAPFVEAELNKRFLGREFRRSTNRSERQESWEKVQAAWTDLVARVLVLPAYVSETSVDGEWTFMQTLRHLIMATDVWLRGAIQGIEQPYHPIGQPFSEYASDGYDMSHFTETAPSLARVLDVRSGRQAMVTDFLATASDRDLSEERPNPWAPAQSVTVGRCLSVILNEEWEHLPMPKRIAPNSVMSFLPMVRAKATGTTVK